MKKILPLLALIVLAVACQKEEIIPKPLLADTANNLCVMSEYIRSNSTECETTDNCNHCDVTEHAENKRKFMVNSLNYGFNGTKYTVLDSKRELYDRFTCSTGPDGYLRALVWAKYDCRGIAVDIKIYGPYPQISTAAKKAEHEAELRAQGYEIAYTSIDRTGVGSNLFYITIYAYKPNAKNKEQAAAVSALQDASFMNTLVGMENIPLMDSLIIAKTMYPEIAARKDYQLVEGLVKISRMNTIDLPQQRK